MHVHYPIFQIAFELWKHTRESERASEERKMRRETAEGRRREREAAYLMERERERERDWRRRRKPTRKSNWTNVKIIDAHDATRATHAATGSKFG